MNNKKTNITIYNQRLAGYLMLNGFPLVGMEENKFDSNPIGHKKNVFFFNDSEDLQKRINEWLSLKRK